MAKSRPTTEDDIENLKASILLRAVGRSDAGRRAFRSLTPLQQEEIHARAAADRERQANGPHLT